jgi:ribosomal protein S18 acetylase RimI-like enzyme
MMAKVETLICEDRDNRDVRAGLVRAVLAHCRRAGVRHLSVRLDAEDLATVDVLERNGFRLVDAMCIFLYDLKEQPVLDPSSTGDFRVRPIRKAEVSAIRAMAQEAFRQGRFHRDGNLPQDRSDALYAGLARALRKDGTAEILAAEVAGKCVGFIAGVPDHALNPFLAKRLAYLWLVTVLPEYCGRGIATGLTKALLAALAGKVDLVEIGTQVYNYPALRLYQRLGCRPVSSVLTFHRWEESVATSW